MRHTRWLALLAALLLGCIGTDVGNPEDDSEIVTGEEADGNVSLTALPLEAASSSRRDNPLMNPKRLITADGLTIHTAWIAVDSLLLCQERKNKNPKCKRQKVGPAALNLITGETMPKQLKTLSKSGTYDTIVLNYQTSRSIGELVSVPELKDAAIFIQGIDLDGRPFTVSDGEGGQISFQPQGGVTVQKGDNLFALKLSPDKWLSAAALGELDEDPILISRAHNIPLFAYFERAFQTTTELLYDADADGDMSDEEREHPLASGD
jgi:hypothetical protein